MICCCFVGKRREKKYIENTIQNFYAKRWVYKYFVWKKNMCDHKNKQSLFSLSNVYAYLKFIDLTFVFDCDLSTWLWVCMFIFQCIQSNGEFIWCLFFFSLSMQYLSHKMSLLWNIFLCLHAYLLIILLFHCIYLFVIWHYHLLIIFIGVWIYGFLFMHILFVFRTIILFICFVCMCVCVNYLFWSTIFWEGKMYPKNIVALVICCWSN